MIRSSLSTLALASALSALTLILPPPAQAADKYWNTGSMYWDIPGAWTPMGVPGVGDDVHLQNNGTGQDAAFYRNLSHPNDPPLLNSFYVDAPNGGDMLFFQGLFQYNHAFSATSEYIGYGAQGRAMYAQSGGTNTTGSLILGLASGGNGIYALSKDLVNPATGSVTATTEQIGVSGTGTFVHSAGTNTVGDLYLGFAQGGAGSYNLYLDANYPASSSLTATNEYIGLAGIGSFVQTTGPNTVHDLYLGYAQGSTGSYQLSKDPTNAGTGSLAATNESIGLAGTGTFNHSAGTNTATSLTIAAAPGAAGAYNLSGGNLSVTTMTVNAGGTFTYTGGAFAYRTLDNAGGTVNNSCTLTSAPQAALTNSGTLNNNAWGTLNLQTSFFNDGTLNNNDLGTLNLQANFFNHGTLNNQALILASAFLGNGATFNNNAEGWMQSANFLDNYGTFNNVGVLRANNRFANETGCTFTNAGIIEIYNANERGPRTEMHNEGNFFNCGSLNNDGIITTYSSGTFTNSGNILNGGTVENSYRSLLVNASGGLWRNGGPLVNTGGTLTNEAGATMENSGTIVNARGNMNWEAPAIVNNYGSISGEGLYRQSDGGETNNYGAMSQSFDIGSGTLLTNHAGATMSVAYGLNHGGTMTNAGTVDNRGAFSTDDWAEIQSSGVLQNSGTMDLNGYQARLDNLGTLINSGALNVNGGMLWNYGTMTSSGTLNVSNGLENYGTLVNTGTFNITGFSYSTGLIENAGTLNEDAGGYFYWAGSINNSGAMNIYGVGELNGPTVNSGVIDNLGLLAPETSLDNTGTIHNHAGCRFYSSVPVYSSGTLINSGTLDGPGQYVQTAGQTINTESLSQETIDVQGGSFVAGGTVSTTDGLTNSGFLSGDGIIQGAVQNNGIVGPGSPVGVLTIDGNYRQSATGTLLIELGGLSQYGWLDITGTADLYGHLEVDLFGGFVPVAGNEFDFLTATGGVFGTFQDYDLPYGLSHWDIGYGPDRATLTYLEGTPAVPEPSTVALLVVGLAGMVAFRRRVLR